MWCILRLATMEVKNKSMHEITVFWKLFNEILSDIKGRYYKFNLRSIMVNENAANYCAIQKVFGLDFVTSKVVRCTIRMISIGCPSGLVKVTEIFSKAFVMKCVSLQT